MRAVYHKRYGSAREALEYSDNFPMPACGSGDILVKVRATSVNPIDCAVRKGYGAAYFEKIGIAQNPHIPGRDVAGDVVQIGENVSEFSVGDKIWAGVLSGASAEYIAIPAEWAAPMPRGLSVLEAAAFPFAGLTAWTALVKHAGLTPENAKGKKVIVPRGAGGVGSFAIQLLKAWGAHVATIVSSRNVGIVRSLGADVIIDHSKEDFADFLHEYDVAFDTSFDTETRLLRSLKTDADASYVSVVTPKLTLIDEHGLEKGTAEGERVFNERVKQQAKLGRRYAWSFMQPDGDALRQVTPLFENGRIKSIIDSVYALEDLADAHEHSESGAVSGKIMVEIN